MQRYGWARTLLLCCAAILAALASRPAQAADNTLMVLYFDNNTGDARYDHLSKGLADMMITDLSAVNSLQLVEREKLESLLKELKLQRSKYFDPKTTQKIGKGAGAAFAVTGAFVSFAPNMRLDVRVIKIDTGTVVKSASVTGDPKDFFELQQKLTAQLVDGLSDILSAADARKARDSSAKNRVTLTALVDYGQGLDARDQGNLNAASELLQKVVSASPEFALGKTRYMQIMRDLYAAKNTRESLLSDSEKTLLEHIQRHLGSGRPSERLGYRVLLGQYHLTKLAQKVKQPASAYRENLDAYVSNQQALFGETKDMSAYNNSSGVATDDFKMAEDIGIKQPGRTFGADSPSQVMRHLNAFLMWGEPSMFDARISPTETICYYKLDPRYGKVALSAMEKAIAHIERFEDSYREREVMRSLRELARTLVLLNRPEEAIAKLQSGLNKYPKSEEFESTEQMLREILGGKGPTVLCKAPR